MNNILEYVMPYFTKKWGPLGPWGSLKNNQKVGKFTNTFKLFIPCIHPKHVRTRSYQMEKQLLLQ
jgi:hypothetical protein